MTIMTNMNHACRARIVGIPRVTRHAHTIAKLPLVDTTPTTIRQEEHHRLEKYGTIIVITEMTIEMIMIENTEMNRVSEMNAVTGTQLLLTASLLAIDIPINLMITRLDLRRQYLNRQFARIMQMTIARLLLPSTTENPVARDIRISLITRLDREGLFRRRQLDVESTTMGVNILVL
jgi:hypothetical protein